MADKLADDSSKVTGNRSSPEIDEFWNALYQTYYDSYLNEVISDRVANRWEIFDDVGKVVVAVTASGSAISGWALWNNPNWRWLWTLIASTSAVVGIVQTSLQTANRVKSWSEAKRTFAGVRIELETLMFMFRFDAQKNVSDFEQRFVELRKKFLEAVQLINNDIMLRKGLKLSAQEDVDSRIKQEEISSNGS